LQGVGETRGGSRRDRVWLAYAALLVAVSGVAWSAIFIRWSAVPGPSSAFYRVFIAALVLLPWRGLSSSSSAWGRKRTAIASANRRSLLLAFAGGVFFGMDLAFYNTAVMRTTATMATLLGNNAPIFVGIGTWLLFKRPPTRRYWAGLALALSGALIVMIAMASNQSRSGDLAGAFMALAAAVFFAAYLLATEHVREQMDTLTFNAVAIAGSVVTLLIVCVIVDAPLGGFSARTWMALLALGLISQLGAYLALTYALGHLPATVTSVGLLAQVPLTAMLAIPLLGEPLSASYLTGGTLVLAGIYIVNSAK
jgi:drug/metabolite transporter (DMT)-like permease